MNPAESSDGAHAAAMSNPSLHPPYRQPPHEPSKSRGCLGIALFLGFMVTCLGGLFVMMVASVGSLADLAEDDGLTEEYHSLNRSGSEKIAIITIEGAILDGDGYVKSQIERVKKDDDVVAVVLRVDSPGGTVTGSDYIYHHLQHLRTDEALPMVVSMGGMAASGGYYVAMAAGETENIIYAEPTTWTGSIGVIIPHYNVAGLMEKWNVESDSVTSHRLKGMGSITKKMTDEERAIFQGLVDDSFTRFKEIVKSGRPKFKQDEAALDAVATGQVFTTSQAIANGLVDKEGFIEAAIDRAIELAGVSKSDVRVVEYTRVPNLGDILLGGNVSVRHEPTGLDLSAILELTTPRAYYLCTWLPGLSLGSQP